MDQNCLLLNRWWRLLISSVVYKSAGYNYWSAMSSTNPRCSLQIRGVIYQSLGVNYWSAEKNKMLKTDPKKVPSQKYGFAFYEKKISHFTIPLIWCFFTFFSVCYKVCIFGTLFEFACYNACLYYILLEFVVMFVFLLYIMFVCLIFCMLLCLYVCYT